MNDACARCGSTKIIPKVPVLDSYGETGAWSQGATIEVAGAPQNFFFKDKASGGVHARICGDCGYMELFASNYRALYAKHVKATGGEA